MNTLAHFVDLLLYALVALTAALILYKSVRLLAPGWLGKPSLAQELAIGSRKELDERIEALESGMALLAVIASASPFIGLAGTVMHIIEALRAMSAQGIEVSVISGPIATALNSTLVGLASAIPAATAYSLLSRRLQVLENRAARSLSDAA